MTVFYFTHPVYPERVAKIITDLSVRELVKNGVFEKQTQYLTIEPDQILDCDLDGKLFDFYEFDMLYNPTSIVINLDRVRVYRTEQLRFLRNNTLSLLDNFMVRAIGSNNLEALGLIEADKEVLRNLPDRFGLSELDSAKGIMDFVPEGLKIEYTPSRYGIK